eukprot:EG_transcript_37539
MSHGETRQRLHTNFSQGADVDNVASSPPQAVSNAKQQRKHLIPVVAFFLIVTFISFVYLMTTPMSTTDDEDLGGRPRRVDMNALRERKFHRAFHRPADQVEEPVPDVKVANVKRVPSNNSQTAPQSLRKSRLPKSATKAKVKPRTEHAFVSVISNEK